jgi:hypothetical protein
MTRTEKPDKQDDPMPEETSEAPPGAPRTTDSSAKSVGALLRERFGIGR